MTKEEVIVDATDAIVGRMASKVTKMLLKGKYVTIINAEKAKITGKKESIINKYLVRRSLQSKQNPEKSPKWPKVPNLLLRRIIRGMLPRKKARGKAAFKRLKVYIGNPLQKEGIKIEEALKETNYHITLYELCKRLGWNG